MRSLSMHVVCTKVFCAHLSRGSQCRSRLCLPTGLVPQENEALCLSECSRLGLPSTSASGVDHIIVIRRADFLRECTKCLNVVSLRSHEIDKIKPASDPKTWTYRYCFVDLYVSEITIVSVKKVESNRRYLSMRSFVSRWRVTVVLKLCGWS